MIRPYEAKPPIPATIGARIKQIRQWRSMTLDALAKESGISASYLSYVENDKRDISSGNLLLVADALGASLDYLIRGCVVRQMMFARRK